MMSDKGIEASDATTSATTQPDANGVVVRPACPQELAEVGVLTETAYRAGGPLFYGADDSYAVTLRQTADRAERAELLVAVDDTGTLLGTVTIARTGSPYVELCQQEELELRMLAVAQQARGRGIGAALIRAVVDRARDEGAHRVVLSSMRELTAAHRLYERSGFRRCPNRDWIVPPETLLLAFTFALSRS